MKTDGNGWNVILYRYDGKSFIEPQNQPDVSGDYLCTCILKYQDHEHRYLQMMTYDAEQKYWHDVGHKHRISHHILAWKEEEVCNFTGFDFKCGILFKKGDLDKK